MKDQNGDEIEIGDWIEFKTYSYRSPEPDETEVRKLELFRQCPGVFMSEDDRRAGVFAPLSELYLPGPESRDEYISNYGNFTSNMVPNFWKVEKGTRPVRWQNGKLVRS